MYSISKSCLNGKEITANGVLHSWRLFLYLLLNQFILFSQFFNHGQR